MTLGVILILLVILAGATILVPLTVSTGVSARSKYVLRSVALFAVIGSIVGFIFSFVTEFGDFVWPLIWLMFVLPISMIGGAIFGAFVGYLDFELKHPARRGVQILLDMLWNIWLRIDSKLIGFLQKRDNA
jgi:hypothetical protein